MTFNFKYFARYPKQFGDFNSPMQKGPNENVQICIFDYIFAESFHLKKLTDN